MKRLLAILFIFTLGGVFFISGTTSASEVNWSSSYSYNHPGYQIDTQGSTPEKWFYFPSEGTTTNPFPGIESTDTVENFTISFKGHDYTPKYYNGPQYIDVFLSFDTGTPTNYELIARTNPNGSSGEYFGATIDLLAETLTLVDAWDEGVNPSPVVIDKDYRALFSSADDFWVGFGCDFKLEEVRSDFSKTTYDNGGGNGDVIPEPGTMFLFGSGLIGLAGFGRKRYFKKSSE